MVDRRGGQSLGLSSLRSEKEYPLVGRGVDERCLIHVKLTESSAKDIDNLIASNKVKHHTHTHTHTQTRTYSLTHNF